MDFIQRFIDLQYIGRSLPLFWQGLQLTLAVGAVATVLSMLIGCLMAFLSSTGRPAERCVRTYIEIFRNSPLLIHIYLVYFGLPQLGLFPSALACGVVALSLQYGAYFTEVVRGGINSVNPKQVEAAHALGMRRGTTFRLVVLPQSAMNALPAAGNQTVLLLKDTSLVSAIGVAELTLIGKRLAEQSGAAYEVFLVIGVLFLVLNALISVVLRAVEVYFRNRFA